MDAGPIPRPIGEFVRRVQGDKEDLSHHSNPTGHGIDRHPLLLSIHPAGTRVTGFGNGRDGDRLDSQVARMEASMEAFQSFYA